MIPWEAEEEEAELLEAVEEANLTAWEGEASCLEGEVVEGFRKAEEAVINFQEAAVAAKHSKVVEEAVHVPFLVGFAARCDPDSLGPILYVVPPCFLVAFLTKLEIAGLLPRRRAT